MFFKRKPKLKKHFLRDVAVLPAHHNFYRALKCTICGKQFIMDVFGGWAVEWSFKVSEDGWRVDKEDLEEAVKYKGSVPVSKWFQVDQSECKGADNQ